MNDFDIIQRCKSLGCFYCTLTEKGEYICINNTHEMPCKLTVVEILYWAIYSTGVN
jgi:hypothetical protein